MSYFFSMLVLAEPKTDLVRERWARSERLGAHRDSDAYPVGITEADLAERRERLEHALRDERELLEPITTELARGPMVAIVADHEGVILSAQADRKVVDPIARVRLVEGARWGESTRGTNAIGTALVEGRPIAVVGRAHFEHRNRNIFCYATPIRDAYGDIVAVLDVTGPLAHHDAVVGAAVQAAGLTLERAIRSMAYGDRRSGALGAIERLVHRASAPTLLVEASGVARIVNAAARRALFSGATTVSPADARCERIFGVTFAELLQLAERGETLFETTHGVYRIAIDPIAGAADRTLAVLVHFEEDRPLVSASPVSTPIARAPISSPPPSVPAAPELGAILASDPGVIAAKNAAASFAATPLPVLLLAETGTGKELFARAIHGASPRRDRAFVAVNCGALSPELLASELFGYAPGAFTGAARAGSEGRIAAADGGTLFLDEIAEMSKALQAVLLRVLDDGVYQRVGETRDRRADFRLVCATCRDLPAMVADGSFRSDLFYRIQGACVTIPPLRDRSDRVWLAEQLAGPAARLTADAKSWIDEHDWPGNVRELKSAVLHAKALSNGAPEIDRDHFPRPLGAPSRGGSTTTRKSIVRDAIRTTLAACAGNVSEAARRLGASRNTIYRALKDED